MTYEEVRKRKETLEADINKLIRDFRKECEPFKNVEIEIVKYPINFEGEREYDAFFSVEAKMVI